MNYEMPEEEPKENFFVGKFFRIVVNNEIGLIISETRDQVKIYWLTAFDIETWRKGLVKSLIKQCPDRYELIG